MHSGFTLLIFRELRSYPIGITFPPTTAARTLTVHSKDKLKIKIFQNFLFSFSIVFGKKVYFHAKRFLNSFMNMQGTIEYPNLFQYLASLNLFKLLKSCLKIVFMDNSISNTTVSMDERDSNFPRKLVKSELEFGYSCHGNNYQKWQGNRFCSSWFIQLF